MKTIWWMLCLLGSSAAIAQEQTYDYQGAAMTGDGATETYTASFTFFGPLTSPDTGVNYLINVTGSAYTGGWGCNGCAIGAVNFNTMPTTLIVNSLNNVLTSAYIKFYSAGALQVPYVNIGANGDSLRVELAPTGATELFVSNKTPGIWTEAPEIDPSTAFGAVMLLGSLLLMVRARPA